MTGRRRTVSSSSPPAAKRARKVVSLKDKVEAIDQLKMGQSVKELAEKYGVSVNTVRDWKKSEATLREQASSVSSPSSRKIIQKSGCDLMEISLVSWIQEAQQSDLSLSSAIIREKARQLYDIAKQNEPSSSTKVLPTFTASNGWFKRFCERRGVKLEIRRSEVFSSKQDPADDFVRKMAPILDGNHSIFNASETGILSKKSHSKTYRYIMREEENGEEANCEGENGEEENSEELTEVTTVHVKDEPQSGDEDGQDIPISPLTKEDIDYILHHTRLVMDCITQKDHDAERTVSSLGHLQQVFNVYHRARMGGLQPKIKEELCESH